MTFDARNYEGFSTDPTPELDPDPTVIIDEPDDPDDGDESEDEE